MSINDNSRTTQSQSQAQNGNQTTNNNNNVSNQNPLTIQEKRKQSQKEVGFQFIKKANVSSYLICKICHQLMIFPMRLFPCGHTYCKRCLKYQRRCPIPPPQCGKFYMALQPDIVATNLIDDLQVKCLSKDCPWYGTLDQFKKKHSKQCQLKHGGLQQWLKGIRHEVSKFDQQKQQRKKMSMNLQYQPYDRLKQKQKQIQNEKSGNQINILQVEVIHQSAYGDISNSNSLRNRNKKSVQIIDIDDGNVRAQPGHTPHRHHHQTVNQNNINKQRLEQLKKSRQGQPQEIVLDLDEDIEAEFFNNYEGLPESSKKMVNNWKKKIDKTVQHLPVIEISKKKQDLYNINAYVNANTSNQPQLLMAADKKLIKQVKKNEKQTGYFGSGSHFGQ